MIYKNFLIVFEKYPSLTLVKALGDYETIQIKCIGYTKKEMINLIKERIDQL